MPISFSSYQQYVTQLHALAGSRVVPKSDVTSALYEAALNGEAGRELARLVPLASRRWGGAFFTGSELAAKLASRLQPRKNTVVADPTVGAGDLLLAAARSMPRGRSIGDTLEIWGERFAGMDRVPQFIEATRLRLWMLAHYLHRSQIDRLPDKCWLPAVQQGDIFESSATISDATDLLLNPPFAKVRAPKWYEHGQGKVNAAAIITEFVVKHLRSAGRVYAILPEVLRTGSLYENWRQSISRSCDVRHVQSCGVFHSADVDVFLVTLEKRPKTLTRGAPWATPRKAGKLLGDRFDVKVGAVVDYRDPRKGRSSPFIHPKNVTVWTELHRIAEKRKFEGHLFSPPFVVLRRTSSPKDRWRAAATLVHGKRKVAVENHLIVCRPKDGDVGICRDLITAMKDSRTNRFLNKEMRCRHLTVEVVKRIPFSEKPAFPFQ